MRCWMDVVRGSASSSDSDKDLDNSESSDINIPDSSDVCHGQYRSLNSSCNLLPTD